jgi:signal transduction histidine kinase
VAGEMASSGHNDSLRAEVTGRFGILPNFFRSAPAAPELIEKLWSFARAAYLDNPIPALFKERLFVVLSRLCPMRYCIVRHVGFLIGHGRPAGDPNAPIESISDVIRLLKQPTPWNRDMSSVYRHLQSLQEPIADWPLPRTETEDFLFACASVVFSQPTRAEAARSALLRAVGARRFEFLVGLLAFIRTAHYWTMTHPEIETEEDTQELMGQHEELARLLVSDPEADRCEMGARLFDELQALRELNEREELKKAKAELEQKDRKKDEFIAILAHELRSPLAAIRSAADALNQVNLDDPWLERLRGALDRQSAVMARMLEDLLDAGRIAFGKVSVERNNLDFTALVRDMAADAEQRAGAVGLDLEQEIPAASLYVKGDDIRLRQIVDNLLSNGIKFTPAPGRIAVRLAADDGHVTLRVEDTGIGFDPSLGDHLFEPFVQQEHGLAHSQGGLGLGLAISRTMATLHNGILSAESSGLGRGAAFTLILPLANSSATVAPPIVQPRRSETERILLIEDNRDAADVLVELIKLLGGEIVVAYDGRAGLALARERQPDLILCDLGLPGGMDGYDFAREVRRDARLKSIRMVAVSGYSQPRDRAAAEEAGFNELLSKPVTVETIRTLLNRN